MPKYPDIRDSDSYALTYLPDVDLSLSAEDAVLVVEEMGTLLWRKLKMICCFSRTEE